MAAKKRKTELDLDAVSTREPAREAPPAPAMAAESAPIEAIGEEEAPKKPPIPRKYIIAGVAGAVALLVLTLAGVFLVKKIKSIEKKKPAVKEAEKPKKPPVEVQKLSNFMMEPFTIETYDEKGRRFLRIGLAIELSNEDAVNEMEQNTPIMREVVYVFLKGRPLSDFEEETKKKEAVDDIKMLLDRSLQSGRVKNILITEMSIY